MFKTCPCLVGEEDVYKYIQLKNKCSRFCIRGKKLNRVIQNQRKEKCLHSVNSMEASWRRMHLMATSKRMWNLERDERRPLWKSWVWKTHLCGELCLCSIDRSLVADLWKPRKLEAFTRPLFWLKSHSSLLFTLFTIVMPSEVFFQLITPASNIRVSLLCLLWHV